MRPMLSTAKLASFWMDSSKGECPGLVALAHVESGDSLVFIRRCRQAGVSTLYQLESRTIDLPRNS